MASVAAADNDNDTAMEAAAVALVDLQGTDSDRLHRLKMLEEELASVQRRIANVRAALAPKKLVFRRGDVCLWHVQEAGGCVIPVVVCADAVSDDTMARIVETEGRSHSELVKALDVADVQEAVAIHTLFRYCGKVLAQVPAASLVQGAVVFVACALRGGSTGYWRATIRKIDKVESTCTVAWLDAHAPSTTVAFDRVRVYDERVWPQ